MSKMLFYLGALALAPGLAALASAEGTRMTAKVRGLACEVLVSSASGGVDLKAVAAADRIASGTYQFEISKKGPGGVSDISQGGEFSVGPEEQEVGTAWLGLEAGASYHARLVLRDAEGNTLCATDARS